MSETLSRRLSALAEKKRCRRRRRRRRSLPSEFGRAADGENDLGGSASHWDFGTGPALIRFWKPRAIK